MATRKFTDATGLTEFWAKVKAHVSNVLPTKTSDLTNDSGFLTSHQSIKTINSTSMVGSGNVDIQKIVPVYASNLNSVVSGTSAHDIVVHDTDENTLNTPYNAGLTDAAKGICITVAITEGYWTQTFIPYASIVSFQRYGTPGPWVSNWSMVGTGDVDVTERAIWVGTCNTAADEQNKVVTCAGFTLEAGAVISVKYTYTNTYSATAEAPVTLNVNNTGAKQIYYNNTATPTGTNTTAFGYANRSMLYVYDGTYWVWLSHGSDNNTTYSVMSVSEMNTGTATTGRLLSAARIKATLQRKATASTTDLTAGVSALGDGEIYLVYE